MQQLRCLAATNTGVIGVDFWATSFDGYQYVDLWEIAEARCECQLASVRAPSRI